jgi:hypothetical protein
LSKREAVFWPRAAPPESSFRENLGDGSGDNVFLKLLHDASLRDEAEELVEVVQRLGVKTL